MAKKAEMARIRMASQQRREGQLRRERFTPKPTVRIYVPCKMVFNGKGFGGVTFVPRSCIITVPVAYPGMQY